MTPTGSIDEYSDEESSFNHNIFGHESSSSVDISCVISFRDDDTIDNRDSSEISIDLSEISNTSIATIDKSDTIEPDSQSISLDQSILRQMNDCQVSETKDRFPYLKLYQKLLNENILNFDNLDDYSKYVKQTELNHLIHSKLLMKKNDNILPTNVLTSNYHGNFDQEMQAKKPNKNSNLNLLSNSSSSWWCKGLFKKLNLKSDLSSNCTISDYKRETISNNGDFKQPQMIENTFHDPKGFTYLYGTSAPKKVYLQRKLKIRHLQMISLGGTLGVGLLLNSGKAINIAGGFGATLAFSITGLIVFATVLSFSEMVTFVSVVDGVSGLSSRFVDDAFGFAVGWLYFLSFAVGLAGEIVASVIMLAYYPYLKITTSQGSAVGFVFLFLALTVTCNLIDIRVFGEVEYLSSLGKLIAILVMTILMILLNTGKIGGEYIGFRYWNYSKSDFDHNLIFGLFRPNFNLHDNGINTEGIPGASGRLLSLIVAIMVTSFAYSGTEIVCIAACEAKDPRRALPSATKRVFWRILIFYVIAVFVVSLNIYAGDPRLLRYWGQVIVNFDDSYAINYVGGWNCHTGDISFAGYGSGAQSPWIIALQSSNLCRTSWVINGLLVFCAVSCGNAQLYVSSRTVYSLALQGKAPRVLTRCNRWGIPYVAVLFAASFGLFSLISVSEKATVVFQNLTSLISSSGIMVWFAMNLSFIRFYYGLKKRPDIISRNDKLYPYKSFGQPFTAMIGLFGSGFIILGMGWVVFLNGEWNTWFFFSSYGTIILFFVLYFGYRFAKGSRIPSLEQLDYDSGRTELDREIWSRGRTFDGRSIKDVTNKLLSFLA